MMLAKPLKVEFKFYGTPPNIYEINNNGERISRPHHEISNIRNDGSRFASIKIKKEGVYYFSGFILDKNHPFAPLIDFKPWGWVVIQNGLIRII